MASRGLAWLGVAVALLLTGCMQETLEEAPTAAMKPRDRNYLKGVRRSRATGCLHGRGKSRSFGLVVICSKFPSRAEKSGFSPF